MLTDPSGRERIFHGVNVVYKLAPYHPPLLSGFQPQLSFGDKDVEFLVQNGFNMVRLYVSWHGLEAEKDNYNSSYLDVIEGIVNKLGRRGIYTLLDCHQDLMSPKFCGEGFPDYASLYDRSIELELFPIPTPSLIPYQINETTGYPFRSECDKHAFADYYTSYACSKAWQSLYDNDQGVQDRFGLFWQKVAQRFNGNDFVLGYELLNEPWAGNIYEHPQDFIPEFTNKKYLLPMYQTLHQMIRKYDDNHIIFFEPVADIISAAPLPSNFGEGPGGHAYNNRQVFSFHLYCLLHLNVQILDLAVCDAIEEAFILARMADTMDIGVAGFLTEWGAYGNFQEGSDSEKDAADITALADQFLLSWSYWQYKGFADITTTQIADEEGFWDGQGNLEEIKLKTLSYPYAMAVAGHYQSMVFTRATSQFELSYDASTRASERTTIFLSEKYHYPNGFNATVSPTGYATLHHQSPYLFVNHTTAIAEGQLIKIMIVPVN
jgi:endoglycosylceramidase